MVVNVIAVNVTFVLYPLLTVNKLCHTSLVGENISEIDFAAENTLYRADTPDLSCTFLKLDLILIEDHHEAIVDRELFQRVQEKRLSRFKGAKFVQYPFGSLPRCPHCGEVLHRRRCLYRDLNGVWICDDENCGKFAVLSKDLEQAAVDVYNASNQNVGEITQAEKWWVDQLIDSFLIEREEEKIYLTVKWKNGESTRVEIPIDKETPEYILDKERGFKIRHGMEV